MRSVHAKTKTGMTVVEAVVATAILLLLAAIALPAYTQNRQKRRAAECAMNLDSIAVATRRHVQETGAFPSSPAALVPTYLRAFPACPAGGAYSLGSPSTPLPSCTVAGHHP